MTGDGASVMMKFGKLLKIPYIVCICHTINLVALATMFTKDDDETNLPSHQESSDSEEEIDLNGKSCPRTVGIFQPSHDLKSSVEKMRSINKMFRKSPSKTSILREIQKKAGISTPLSLLMDCKTRWNSLVVSCSRFLLLLPHTLAALKHRDIRSDLVWEDIDTKNLTQIVEILEPAKVATENMSNSTINILAGEGIVKFLHSEIEKLIDDNPIAKSMAFRSILETRMKDRRDPLLVSLVMYLNNRDSLKNDHPFGLAPKSAVIKYGVEMAKRLFNEESQDVPELDTLAVDIGSSLQERLKMSVGSLQSGSSVSAMTSNSHKKDFEYYERHQVRSPMLNKLFDALSSLQPTSTQSERNFSLAANVMTPNRSRLSISKFDAQCFLKSYFLGQK